MTPTRWKALWTLMATLTLLAAAWMGRYAPAGHTGEGATVYLDRWQHRPCLSVVVENEIVFGCEWDTLTEKLEQAR